MEDNPEIASLYSSVLEDRGHVVTLAYTGEECLKMYSKSLQMALLNRFVLRNVPSLTMSSSLIIKCQTEMGYK